jgi:hypothetical protein
MKKKLSKQKYGPMKEKYSHFRMKKFSKNLPLASLKWHRQEAKPSSMLVSEFHHMPQCFAANKN